SLQLEPAPRGRRSRLPPPAGGRGRAACREREWVAVGAEGGEKKSNQGKQNITWNRKLRRKQPTTQPRQLAPYLCRPDLAQDVLRVMAWCACVRLMFDAVGGIGGYEFSVVRCFSFFFFFFFFKQKTAYEITRCLEFGCVPSRSLAPAGARSARGSRRTSASRW